MSPRPPCDRLLGWARRVLEPSVVTQVIEPCVADVRHEHAAHLDREDPAGARRVALAGAITVLGLVLRLRLERRVHAAGRAAWWALLPAVATALLATIGMAEARPGAARAQLVFVAVGVVGAALTATTSGGTIRRAGRVFALVVPLALLVVLLRAGESEHAARRWVGLGPLHVHVAALAMPAFVLALSHLLTTRRPWLGAVFAVLTMCLVAVQPDVTSIVVLGMAALATAWAVAPRTGRGLVAVIAAGALVAVSIAAFVMPPFRSEPATPDGGLALLLARGAPWLVAALGGLVLTVRVAGSLALRRRTSSAVGEEGDGEDRDGAHAFERGLGAGLVAAMATQPIAALVAQDGVHLLSHGGSGVVASLVAIGWLIGHARGGVATPRVG